MDICPHCDIDIGRLCHIGEVVVCDHCTGVSRQHPAGLHPHQPKPGPVSDLIAQRVARIDTEIDALLGIEP